MRAGSTTLRVRSGSYAFAAATGELYPTKQPDIYGTVVRDGWRWHWVIFTTGSVDTELAWGRTWTRNGAWTAAIAAAHRPRAGAA